MLTQEDDVEIRALARRGWSVSAIARHTGRDRKTVAKYLAGEAPARAPAPSCVEPFRPYLEARFEDDAHVLATVLYEELTGLGFDRSYPTLVRGIRELGLRPECGCCKAGAVKLTIGLEHEPGEELQLDWLELSETPWGVKAYVLVGALSIRGSCVAPSARVKVSRIWPRRWTACCAASAAPRGRGGPTGCQRLCIPAVTGCGRRRRRWPSTTACRSRCARRTVRSARVWSRRRSGM